MNRGMDGVADAMRAQLAANRPIRLRPSGYSMWPVIRPDAVVVVNPTDLGELRVGDVVLFDAEAVLVLHRVVQTRADAVLTKGDASAQHDGWIPRTRVLGRLARRRWDPALAWLSRHGGATLPRVLHGARRRLKT